MKKIYYISDLFEQEASVDKIKGQKFNFIGAIRNNPDTSVKIQWPYQYTWPKSQPDLGDYEELLKFISTAEKGDAASIRNSIKKAGPTSAIGITKEKNTAEDNRLFGKDRFVSRGWVYLYNPGVIDFEKIPANKKFQTKIESGSAFLVDRDSSQYEIRPNNSNNGSNNGSSNANASSNTTQSAIIVSYLVSPGSKYFDWYTADGGIYDAYIAPTVANIDSSSAPIKLNSIAKTAPIFWTLIDNLPESIKTSAISTDKKTDPAPEFDSRLRDAMVKIFKEAGKFDPNGFSGANPEQLNGTLYNYLARAVIIIGLNSKQINIDFNADSGHASSEKYYKPIKDAHSISRVVKGLAGASETLTAEFDGIVRTEDDILKIFAGLVASNLTTYGNPTPDKYSTTAAVKNFISTNFGGSGYNNMINALKHYGGFEKGKSYPSSNGFKDFKYTLTGKDDGNFDDELFSKIKTLLGNSPIK